MGNSGRVEGVVEVLSRFELKPHLRHGELHPKPHPLEPKPHPKPGHPSQKVEYLSEA